jgi:hypothetical protein
MPVDCELGFAVQNDEHLLALVMKVLPDTALGFYDATMEKDKIGIHGSQTQQRTVIQSSCPVVHCRHVVRLCGIGMADPLLEG